jgi:hypothetical protein
MTTTMTDDLTEGPTEANERPAPRLSPAEVRYARLELSVEMLDLVTRDGLSDAPGDVAQNLSIAKLCLEEAKAALPSFERRERNGDSGRGGHRDKRRKGERP